MSLPDTIVSQLDTFNNKTPILKVIIKRTIFDTTDTIQNDLKLIFIGDVLNKVKTICKQLEENKPLSSEDKKTLETHIPFYSKKLGSLTNYDIKFVYITINPYVTTKHFQILLLDILYHLKVLPNLDDIKKGITLYSQPRITDINYHLKYINFLFFSNEKKESITGLEIVKTIVYNNCLPNNLKLEWETNTDKTDQSVDNWLLEKLKLQSDKEYKKYELIDRSEFVKYIIQGIPYLYTSLKYISQDKQHIFDYSHFNLFIIDEINNKTHSDKENKNKDNTKLFNKIIKGNFPGNDIFLNKDKSRFEENLNYIEMSNNNTIYCYLNIDILNYVSILENKSNKIFNSFKVFLLGLKNKIKFNNQEEWIDTYLHNRRNFTYHLESDCLNEITYQQLQKFISTKKLSKNDTKWINNNPVLFNIKNGYNNIILDIFNQNIDIDINLLNLFQEIRPNYYFPMIKYVKGGVVQSYNIYKPFFRNINKRIIKTYLTSTDIIQKNLSEFKGLQLSLIHI